jgi:hypothetical protein
MIYLTAVTFSVHVAWWRWTVLVLGTVGLCVALLTEVLSQAHAVDTGAVPAPRPIQGDIPDGFNGRRDTEHFILLWPKRETTDEEINEAAARVEDLFTRLAAALDSGRTPEARLFILFEGLWISPTGKRQLPQSDLAGRIHLCAFPCLTAAT